MMQLLKSLVLFHSEFIFSNTNTQHRRVKGGGGVAPNLNLKKKTKMEKKKAKTTKKNKKVEKKVKKNFYLSFMFIHVYNVNEQEVFPKSFTSPPPLSP